MTLFLTNLNTPYGHIITIRRKNDPDENLVLACLVSVHNNNILGVISCRKFHLGYVVHVTDQS